MRFTSSFPASGFCAALLLAALSACGTSEPIEVDEISRPDQMQAGRGLISGSDGELVYEVGEDPQEVIEDIKKGE